MLSTPLKPLLQYQQFIIYRLEASRREGKMNKVPIDPNTLLPSNAHDKSIWLSYEDSKKYSDFYGSEYGIGFVFTKDDPFFFLDIDNCLDENGIPNPVADALIQSIPDAAVEVSVSGKGIHIFGSCTKPIEHTCKNKEWNCELYASGRFVALTDNNTTGNIATNCDSHLPFVIENYFPPTEAVKHEEWSSKPVPESNPIENDDQLIEKALSSKSAAGTFGGKASFADLWNNNEAKLLNSYPPLNDVDPYDRSSADSALASHLAFWTGKDHERIRNLMLQSSLTREKWTKNKSYLTRTISNAVNIQTEVYSKNKIDINETETGSVDYLLLPSNDHPIIDSAEVIFKEIAKHKDLFVHGGQLVELTNNNNRKILSAIIPEAFRSRIEGYGKKLMLKKMDERRLIMKEKRCTTEDAKALMSSRGMVEHLPHIRAVLDCPVFTRELKTLGIGYHAENGGLLITKGDTPPSIPIDEAREKLLNLFRDFEFSTRNDLSRAIGMQLTPALKMGDFIKTPCPVDISEADESQSGKTYRLKLNAAIYNDTPIIVAPKKGGVGSIDESIATSLARGRPFVLLDNLRGMFDSSYLEAVITTPGSVPIRLPKRMEQIIDTRTVTFQLSSNGVNTTRDMANRSCMVRIRKRSDKKWHQWPEGNLLNHVQENQAYYLGCVFSVIREWDIQGRRKTTVTDHDMVEWAQILDWIVQNIFRLPPLLDGHKAIQDEISNPNLVWIRAVCIAAENKDQLGREFQAHDIAELCEEASIEWPGGRSLQDSATENKYIGTIMSKLFEKEIDGQLSVNDYVISRLIKPVFDGIRNRDRKIYIISKKDQSQVVFDRTVPSLS